MLWRVHQGFRHLRQAKLFFLSVPRVAVSPSLLAVQPLHHSFRPQWPPAVTHQARRAHEARQTGQSEIKVEPAGRTCEASASPAPLRPKRQRKDLEAGRHSTNTKSTLPPFASTIDRLFRMLTHRGAFRRPGEDNETVRLLELLSDYAEAGKLALNMVDTQDPERALRVLALAHESGSIPKQNVYEGVAHQLAMRKKWSSVRQVVEMGKRHRGRTTTRLLNWRAQALVETQDFASLDGVLELFKEESLKPNRRTYHIVVAGHLRNRDLLRAKRYLGLMEEAGFPADVSTHALIVTSYRSLGLDPTVKSKALEILQHADQQTSTTIINSLIQLSLDVHDIPTVFRYLSMFDQHAGANGHARSPGENTILRDDDTLDHGRPRGPRQDVATFNMLIETFAKTGDLPRAMQVLQRMKAAGVQPDSRIAAAIVRAHFNAGEANTAVQIVADICGDLPQSRPLFRRLGLVTPRQNESPLFPTGIPPTIYMFNALLQGALRTRGLNGMRAVQLLMQLQGVDMDETSLEIFLSYLDKTERARPREMIRLARQLQSPTVPPTLRHMHIILRSILRDERHLLRLRDRRSSGSKSESGSESEPLSDEASPSFPHHRLSTVAESFDPVGGIEFSRGLSYKSLMQPLLRSLTDRRVRSDRATFALRIQHDGTIKRDMEMAKQSFEAMISRGLHPNEYHFAALMEGYAQCGDAESAADIMKAAVKFGIQLNVKMYTILITGYAIQKNPTEAMRVFNEMVAAGIKPDIPVVHALCSAFYASKARNAARRILLRLWPTVMPFPQELQDAPFPQLLRTFTSIGSGKRKERLSNQQRRLLRWKVRRIAERWRNPESVVRRVTSPGKRMRPV